MLTQDSTADQRIIQDALYFIAQRGWALRGEAFFHTLAHYLAAALDIACVIIGEIQDNVLEQVETRAVVLDGAILPNFVYALANTPCANVIDGMLCVHPHSIQTLFPVDGILQRWNIESYMGLPLINSQGQPIGIISLMDHKPLERQELARTLLQIVAMRVSQELEHERDALLLRRQRDEAQLYLDMVGAIIVALHSDGTVRLINKAGCRLLGYAEPEIVGKNWFDHFLPIAIREETKAIFDTLMREPLTVLFDHENPILTRDGQERIIAWHNTVLYDDQERVVGTLSSGTDITERLQAETARYEADRLRLELQTEKELQAQRSRFISMITHDIRNPLASISFTTNLLHEYQQRLSEQQRVERLNSITSNVQRVSSLVDDLLTLTQLEAASPRFQPEWLDLDALCRKLAYDTETSNGCVIVYQLSGTAHPIYGDSSLLSRVIGNLLGNAVKYSPNGGEITLGLEFDADQVRLCVRDHGIGIPQTDQANLFDVFHRASNVGSIPGTGLGLAIVRHAVKLHDGDVTVVSSIGQGTEFTITLPDVPQMD